MLAKKFRLKKSEVSAVYKRGRGRNFGPIGVKIFANSLGFGRFSVVIPKSLVKNASDRNRLRRIIFTEIAKQKTSGDWVIRLFRLPDNETILRKKIAEIFQSV